ncbi:hypothetical protein [Clostridium sp. ATCC 25772]|nr:hypothetical protein [Clostridium sp. ATCC 25772]
MNYYVSNVKLGEHQKVAKKIKLIVPVPFVMEEKLYNIDYLDF